VAELADALDLGSSAERRAGSSPARATAFKFFFEGDFVGQYIECWPRHGKAALILNEFGGEQISVETARELISEPELLQAMNQAIVCVVDNGPFEAAAYCPNLQEFETFADTVRDPRPRQFLLLDDAVAAQTAIRTMRIIGRPASV